MLPTHISLIMSLLLQKSLEDDPSLCRYTLQAPVQKKKKLRSMLFTLTYSEYFKSLKAWTLVSCT